uniref:Uncharacterized protein n=1 Tax=Rhizophora mucronata TaxID=61149 RepID=A0A2P2NWK4_RHIMU
MRSQQTIHGVQQQNLTHRLRTTYTY